MSNFDKFRILNEDKLIILCSRLYLDTEIKAKIIQILQSDLNWDYLIQKAINHKVLQILYLNLRNFSKFIPEDHLNNMNEYFNINAQNNLLLLGELLKILELLEHKGINAIPYKGPVLAIQKYGELVLRQFGDLDIYIFKKDILKVFNVLISQGYEPEFNINSKWGKKYISSQRELKFFNKSKKIIIEIHWKFTPLFFSFPKLEENLFLEEMKFINMHNKFVISPSDEDLLLILCIHNAGHHWNCLEWIVDIYVLINNSNINWSKVIIKAEKLCIKRILFINLHLIFDLLEINLPDSLIILINDLNSNLNVKKMINEFKLNLLENNKQRTLSEELFISFNMRENMLYGFKDCLRGLLNPSFYEFNNFLLHPYLYYLYYLYRPINLIKRFKLFK